jgi:hypothetical protein
MARSRPHLFLVLAAFVVVVPAPVAAQPVVGVQAGPDGRLVYTPDTQGNAVVDFSYAGYEGGGVAIPDVPVRTVLGPEGGAHRQRIQAAIDAVSAMPPDASGFRGAVLLRPGEYLIDTSLRIAVSGVVLRGSGTAENGTRLVAAGTGRRSLIVVGGRGERHEIDGSRRAIADPYVPVGARELTLEHVGGLRLGDRVAVHRPSTPSWISLLGMDAFTGWRPESRLNWLPGSRDLLWDRRVTAIDGNRISIDAPITSAIDASMGGGAVFRYGFDGRIDHVGVEHLQLVSQVDPARPQDEDHAWVAIALDTVEDAWVRQVVARQFASYVVFVGPDAKSVTVEDCEARDPVSEIGGQRRRVFYTAGQLTLFQRCRSLNGRHDFSVGHAAAGPNVFLDARAEGALDFSGGLESWASGVLFDNVVIRGNAIRFVNRETGAQGAGWTIANAVIWNAEATEVEVHVPPGAHNLAYGCRGTEIGRGIVSDPRATPSRDFHRGSPVQPRSLFLAQLSERLGPGAVQRIAMRPVPVTAEGAREFSLPETGEPAPRAAGGPALRVEGGRFWIGGEPAWTARVNWSWFQAQMIPALAVKSGPAITRFAPGRTGTGLTDDLETVVTDMPAGAAFYQHYGLWYDRRRVNHNYDGSAERRTGDAWAPFMEVPWARSGTGKAWDGLSQYDLTRFNPWYFERVKTFADLADRNGRVLYYNFYFQHWLVESRSHYVDFPWRPVNTIQATGMPDEVPAANAFYDVSHPLRRDLHRRYIRHVLDVLKTNTNLVYGIDREYTGPLEFVQFWLDTIAEWQKETGTRVKIALEVPKDQLDALLDDPVRAPMIAAMDIHGWVYKADGELFAIRGGIDRAPREQRPDIATEADQQALKAGLGRTALESKDFLNGPEFQQLFDALWRSTPAMRYRTVREYRDRYPNLVVLSAALAAGTAAPTTGAVASGEFAEVTRVVETVVPAATRAGMRPLSIVRTPRESAWCSGRPGDQLLVYTMAGAPVELDLAQDATTYDVQWLDPAAGGTHRSRVRVTGAAVVTLTPPEGGTGRPWVAYLVKRAGR